MNVSTRKTISSPSPKPVQLHERTTAGLVKLKAPYNPRRISAHDMQALRRSMREFGVVEPIVVNKRTRHVVGGHQRIEAARAEKMHRLPVLYVDLDETREKQLNLALNRISGDWDEASLEALLSELSAAGADLDLTGFKSDEVDRLLSELTVPEMNDAREPVAKSEALVTIRCARQHVQLFEPTLREWADTDGVEVDIA